MLNDKDISTLVKVGFCGYSNEAMIHPQQEFFVKTLLARIKATHGDNVIIIGGYTNEGINRILYDLCKNPKYQLNMKIGGVTCSLSKNYPCWESPDYLKVVDGNTWGIESQTFIDTIDYLIRVDGGIQSHKEIEMAKLAGVKLIEYQLNKKTHNYESI